MIKTEGGSVSKFDSVTMNYTSTEKILAGLEALELY